MAVIRTALLACLVGIVLYVYFEPIPDAIEIPWKLKLISHLFPVTSRLASIMPEGEVKTWLDTFLVGAMRSSGPNVTYRDTTYGGVPVRVFDDQHDGEKAAKRPAIVYYHGGGWILGRVDLYHALTSEIARETGAVVVSVEYRLAPKHVFPAAIDDCTAATVGFLQHLQDLNVDPTRVAVMGDSAGGNLAAAVAQRLTFDPKYKKLPGLKMQVLIYPCLQAFDYQTPSIQQNGDYKTVILNRVNTAWFLSVYLNFSPSFRTPMSLNQHTSAKAKRSPLIKKCLSHDLIPDEFKQTGYKAPSTDFGDEDIYKEIKDVLLNPDFSPLMREDLRGLPEAYILTAEYDVLRDDGIMYAKRLEKAGVPVTWKHYKKGYHAMFDIKGGFRSSPSSELASEDFYNFAKKHL
ncbi:neutral cholesterol ester hydrolase 1-like [Patiria miniata]|uniref:Alpha/beta hydrolase fold-3 domain-containing protein n=1 Tax=Patiria miniata TaxID=46514 RepID=A0A913ZHG5_PATMI|nr:neutral cholesterol ester hydrolase 1-like [Patiria miniata]XP_038051227.1 neutral cholesterol ester hydrolase 1-like [Patiria miniata]XP_038051228.1 neutral cholesterol ester hydrolase 1-like [Patiria miniata]XP_038051229.1 neutral cholesterol ester hydrolase 1-like [Patiria miniata]XP_038051231.1 neutral cholesterol ester hydrolase 1-like [Patiria miniata]